MGKIHDAVDTLFLHELGDVVFLAQDRWKANHDNRERWTVTQRIIIDRGAERPEVRYQVAKCEYGGVECNVSEHQIDDPSTQLARSREAVSLLPGVI